jgi:ankyrin repeat protein
MVLRNEVISFLLAGYNHLEVAEYLLETGADVNAQDKGGLIPLHNASSYGVSWCKKYSS